MYQNLARSGDTVSSVPESVHHCRFPQADPGLVDRDLSAAMDAAADLVSRILSLRQTRQLRVRQPLPAVTVACREPAQAAALQRFASHILEEVNVKSLQVTEDASRIVAVTVKPNFPVLGPKYGRAAPAIAKALTALDAREVAARLKAGTAVSVAAGDRTVELVAEDIVVQTTTPPSIVLHEGPDMVVALDTTLTAELVAEGLARDVVRHVQLLRKELHLEPDDRIVLSYAAAGADLAAAIATWLEYIKAETLAVAAHDTMSGQPDQVVKIGGVDLALQARKA
jgi:isoleucyl-tRNA synthetase